MINNGSGSSYGKSRILDPDLGNHPITDSDPDLDLTCKLQIDKKDIKICHFWKGFIWYTLGGSLL